ncbi:MAG TPA: alpha/beta fold hydrolase [Thermoanaerobaculia bacterium]|nr:alpha/beta fold hydrolase [Thermoanaerobaculia bacterium]
MHTDLSLKYLLNVPSGRPDTDEMPMVVLIHGRGADANDLADLAPLLDPPAGARFVLPNAPKAFEVYPGMAYGWTWFEGWPPQQESVAESRVTLLKFLDEITARYPTSALIVSGFSQGGMMALDAGLRTTQNVSGIVSMSGGLYEDDLPDLREHAKMPILIAHGTEDEVVSSIYARRARARLEEAGFDVDYHEYPMGHQVVMEEITVVKDFIARLS